MSTCLECKRYAMADSDYCFDHNPLISDEAKREAKQKGGERSRKIPHTLRKEDLLPIETPQDLNRLYNALLSASFDAHADDLHALIKTVTRITPRLSELLAFQSLAALEEKLNRLESRRNGRLLPSRADDNANANEFSQQD